MSPANLLRRENLERKDLQTTSPRYDDRAAEKQGNKGDGKRGLETDNDRLMV